MTQIHEQRTIAASPERVFAWLLDPANLTVSWALAKAARRASVMTCWRLAVETRRRFALVLVIRAADCLENPSRLRACSRPSDPLHVRGPRRATRPDPRTLDAVPRPGRPAPVARSANYSRHTIGAQAISINDIGCGAKPLALRDAIINRRMAKVDVRCWMTLIRTERRSRCDRFSDATCAASA